jgi:mRNA interferase MazF
MKPTDLVHRGEVYLVSFDPSVGAETKKARPALVVQNDIGNAFSGSIIVVPISNGASVKRRLPVLVPVAAGVAGLESDSVVNCAHLRTVEKSLIVRRLGRAPAELINAVDRALKISLALG